MINKRDLKKEHAELIEECKRRNAQSIDGIVHVPQFGNEQMPSWILEVRPINQITNPQSGDVAILPDGRIAVYMQNQWFDYESRNPIEIG